MFFAQTRDNVDTQKLELHTKSISTTFLVLVSYLPPLVGIVGIHWLVLLGIHWLVLVGISVGITMKVIFYLGYLSK